MLDDLCVLLLVESPGSREHWRKEMWRWSGLLQDSHVPLLPPTDCTLVQSHTLTNCSLLTTVVLCFLLFYNYWTLQLLTIKLLRGSVIKINGSKNWYVLSHLYIFVPNLFKLANRVGLKTDFLILLLMVHWGVVVCTLTQIYIEGFRNST